MIASCRLAIGHGSSALFGNLCFCLPAGECWAILGRNGSGKSTLLATLAGQLPALDGEVQVLNKPLRRWRRPELALHLGFLPQSQPAVFPYTVEEFVRFGRWPWRRTVQDGNGLDRPDRFCIEPRSRWSRCGRNSLAGGGARSAQGSFEPPPRERDEAGVVEAAIHAMQLGPIRDRSLTGLSGGEAQRVCIAQLLAQSTEILLLDEPLAHLDLLHQIRLMDLLRGLAHRGHAVAVVTHDLDMAWRYCDRLLVLGPDGMRLVARQDVGAVAAALGWAYDVTFQVTPDGPRLGATT